MSEKHKQCDKIWITLSIIFISALSGSVSINTCASLVSPLGIVNSILAPEFSILTAIFKKYKSILTKKRKKYNKIVLLANTKLSTINF